MKVEFDLDKKLEQLATNAGIAQKKIAQGVEQSAKSACSAMEYAAKLHTPHEGDGKRRGFNVISNSLQESWHAEYIKEKNDKLIGKVVLTNDKDYAPFVQYGHRMSKHFVPWLYKDGMGTLSYETDHNQPLFGLVVGTKTPYVKGVDMLGPAKKAFDEKFSEEMQKVLKKIKL